jgi:aconitate hydratase
VVTDYLVEAGVMEALDKLRFNLVGYGCTTCIGNSGPLPVASSQAIEQGQLVAASVLSGNRNFEGRQGFKGRTHLVSPQMAAAAAIAGHFIDVREFTLETSKVDA